MAGSWTTSTANRTHCRPTAERQKQNSNKKEKKMKDPNKWRRLTSHTRPKRRNKWIKRKRKRKRIKGNQTIIWIYFTGRVGQHGARRPARIDVPALHGHAAFFASASHSEVHIQIMICPINFLFLDCALCVVCLPPPIARTHSCHALLTWAAGAPGCWCWVAAS